MRGLQGLYLEGNGSLYVGFISPLIILIYAISIGLILINPTYS